MKNYEIMYIVRPNLEGDARKEIVESFANIFPKMGSEVTEVKEWGMRDLAYEINDFRKGYYVVMNVTGNSDATDEFDRLARISEDIIRYIIVKKEA